MAKKSHFLLGFVLGAASSLAATYLLTPQTSDELKEKFAKTKDDLADRAADYYDYAKDATAEWRESAQGVVSDLKDKVAAKADTGDVASYDDATTALKDQLTGAPESANNDDFDDIVLDGKSAFAQAKDDAEINAADDNGEATDAAQADADLAASQTADHAADVDDEDPGLPAQDDDQPQA